MLNKKNPISLAALAFCSLPLLAQADTLADVRAVLAQQGQASVKAVIEVKSLSRNGEGKDLEEQQGEAAVQVEDGPQGLRVMYARELLQRGEAEAQNKARDPKTKTVTLSGIAKLDNSNLRELLNPAAKLGRLLDRAKLKGEKVEAWQGKPATLLSFDLEKQKMSGQFADAVKNYSGTLELWVGPQGVPLAAKVRESVSGRAFLVFSFESQGEEEQQFGFVADRLVMLKSESRNHGSSTMGKNESRVTHSLKPQA
ncbi:hypothetical protein [Pelomonas sp. SE-A7]|uniref:hypothetical protein n=1 Tax=Pelomonas sp. SE-A7 TaxID=3054953 RepID=UPI00259C6E0F|nr:hypothetical protein [Pelomonas sp. SE-A7]MDM4768320.1 hypothetical protein [Pelomonas sp. SE-A7]